MVHIAQPPPGIEEFLPLLRAGDIITHCFTGLPMKLFDDDGRLIEVARRAIDAGVILDIGHGAGSFAFRSAVAALAARIRPHAISTDMHQMSVAGPLFDPRPACRSFSLWGSVFAMWWRWRPKGRRAFCVTRTAARCASARSPTSLDRRPASSRTDWAEHWDRGGTNARIRAFQCELVAKGHTPQQMCRCTVGPG
jgi:hypothetical protein